MDCFYSKMTKRSKRCATRALTRFQNRLKEKLFSQKSVKKCLRGLSFQKSAYKTPFLKTKRIPFSLGNSPVKSPNKVLIVKFRNNKNGLNSTFKCFEEIDLFIFSKGVRNRTKTLTEDFDTQSDEETICSAVKQQKKRIMKILKE